MTTSTRSSTTATNDNNPHSEAAAAAAAATAATATAAAAAAAMAVAAAATLHNTSNSPTATAATTTNRVMQADEDFNIRFVNLVRIHKCLYDKKVPEYRNRDNQEKAWTLISKETRESVLHCKERWRNLRACLSRYIKQQSGSEPQHKPYYLTEHMAFLLPFLKSTRNSLEGNNSLATLYQLSQQHQLEQQHLYCNNNNNNNILGTSFELKQSNSENDDEETIDAFDADIAASLGLQRNVAATPAPNIAALAAAAAAATAAATSPAHSDTASANSLQNFIPDVQLAESAQDLVYDDAPSTPPHLQHHHYDPSSAKRIKAECEATTTTSSGAGYYGGLTLTEHTDMEFFRSILPDISALTPQQRRKFKIGILELIDDVVERFPAQEQYNGNGTLHGSGGSSTSGRQPQRRSKDWRK